jgi:membrane protease YdiL (CAAX protease family)
VDKDTHLGYTDPIPPSPSGATLEPAHPAPPENPVFNLVDVLLITIVAFAALIFCSFTALAVAKVRHPLQGDVKELAENVLLLLPAQVASYILTVGFMVFLMWHKYRTRLLDAVCWNLPPAAFAWGAFAAGSGLGLSIQLLSGFLDRWMPKSLPIQQYFRTPSAAYALAAFGILIAPVVEEMFFRGFLYPALARPLGTAVAMVLTSGGFALIHAEQLARAWAPLVVLFIVGMVLTAVRARTRSLAVCVLIHMGYNFTLFAMLYFSTQGFHHMERV